MESASSTSASSSASSLAWPFAADSEVKLSGPPQRRDGTRDTTISDGRVWRDANGRTWVAVDSGAEHLADRVVREVASGTRRGTIEWPVDGDAAAEGLFAARRALLEGVRPGANIAIALPKVEGVLTGGRGIVLERPHERLEQWWSEMRGKKDRVALLLDGMADLARSSGMLVGPSEAEGLVPVIRPRALRRRSEGGWVVTEFAALIDRPPASDSPEVCTGFLPPEAIQGLPARTGSARVSWGIGATLLAICRWARATMDGSNGENIESQSGHSHRGRLLADAHARGSFRGGGEALRLAVAQMPDGDRLPTPDREAILAFAEERDLVRPFGVGLINLLDEILIVSPASRPTPVAIAERLEGLARDVRTELARKRKEARGGTTPSEAPPSPPQALSPRQEPPKKRAPPNQRAIDGLQRKVHELDTKLQASLTKHGELQRDHDRLVELVAKQGRAPTMRPQLVGLAVAVVVALGVAGLGIVLPRPPTELVIHRTADGPSRAADVTSSGSHALPLDGDAADSKGQLQVGQVEVRGGTVSLVGTRGVYGAGAVPVGDYILSAYPHGGTELDLGPVRVSKGHTVRVDCAFGACSLSPGELKVAP